MKDSSHPPQAHTRREFLRFGASCCAALAAPRLLAEDNRSFSTADDFRLNYILASPMYGMAPLGELLPEVSKVGADAIDVWPRSHANHREQLDELGLDAVERLLDHHQVKIEVITRYDLGPARVIEDLPTLRRFGGKLLVCGADHSVGDPTEESIRQFVRKMEPHVEEAAKHGVSIGIENHARSLIHTPESIECFTDAIDFPNFGLALAPYHLPQDSTLIADLIRKLEKRLVFFQAWQHGHGSTTEQPKELELQQLPGRGPLDFVPILSALRQIDYRGRTEIFMHPFPRGEPILSSTGRVTSEINRSRAYLEKCLSA